MTAISTSLSTGSQTRFQYSLRIEGMKRYFEARLVPYSLNEIVALVRDITDWVSAQTELKRHRENLEAIVAQRTEELNNRIIQVERLNTAMVNLLEDYKAANRKLQRMTERLEESNQELEAFAYSVSHDLRAPLRAMQGFSEALLEDYAEVLDDNGKDYARRIVNAAQRMDDLIGDLLEYSRISRKEVHLQIINLEALIKGVIDSMGAFIKDSMGTIDVSGPLPDVMGSKSILEQVVSNLISNALKFSRPGVSPHLRIWAESSDEFVTLNFQDNGIGIPEEHHDRIFKVFERLHGIEEYPGTGIGLAIVKKGVERLRGSAGVESVPGRGSRFWINLIKYKMS
jgi:signal transduction histidine kinase